MLAALVACAAPAAAKEPISTQEAIGWRLFFDPILSRPKNFSCGTCHIPSKGYEDGQALGEGAHGDRLGRNTPTVVNLDDDEFFFWDGRADSLEDQAAGPITNPKEMDLSLEEAVERVRAEPRYQRAFAKAGVRRIEIDDILEAIAAFERRLTTGETAYDRWAAGDRDALDERRERGRVVFFTNGNCAMCHNGRDFSDGDFHNIGTGSNDDPGRGAIVEDDFYLGAFKTPALRNWRGREPFMHDGRFATLREVIDFYVDPTAVEIGEPEIDPVELSEEEIDDLLAFLETLNGAWPDLQPFERAWKELGVE